MPQKTVTVGVDGACRGLETPDGRMFPVRDHVAELPADEARRFLTSTRGQMLHRHTRGGLGWSRRREAAWERVFGGSSDTEEESCS